MHLEFWGASKEVTGSCYLLQVGRKRVLIDCGLIQGSPAQEERNHQAFPFDLNRIDAVVLTHAHLDHSGRLPLLIKAGYRGPIYTHHATKDLCRIMLRDAAYLNEKETQWVNRKRQRKGLKAIQPLYVTRDATAAMRKFRGLEYDVTTEILPGVQVQLRDAGHILGSSIVEIHASEDGLHRKLVFSGDLGHHSAPILRDPHSPTDADLVIMESTYGDRLHRSWEATWAELAGVLAEALQGKGNILIPAFAVGRTQELLYAFARNYEAWGMSGWTVFLDSPLAIEATEVYTRFTELYDKEATAAQRSSGNALQLPNLHFSKTAQQSMAVNRIRSGAIIIAGSGMCEGGRIKHHLKHNIWRSNCHLIIVGYQAQGTLGRALVDGARHIRLWGETVQVAAKVHTVGGFSAHADQAGLLNWYGRISNRPRVALIHGEAKAIEVLEQKLREQQVNVTVPDYGTRIDLKDFRISTAETVTK